MNFISFIGWLAVTGAVVALLVAGKKDARGRLAGGPETKADEEEEWCDAIGGLVGGAVFIFDEGLCLLSSGGECHAVAKDVRAGSHLVDICPQDILPTVMETIARARREGKAVWKGNWAGAPSQASVVQKDGNKFLVCLKVEGS